MKRSLLILIAALLCNTYAFAQRDKNDRGSCPNVYIGLSTGVNNPAGFAGIDVDVPIKDFSVNAGIGLSTWGLKFYGEGRYYFSPCNKGWVLGAGISHAPGGENVDLDIDAITYDPVTKTSLNQNKKVSLDLEPQTNVFFAGYRFFNLGRKSRFYTGLGYSVRLSDKAYSINTANTVLTEDADAAIKVIRPGGIMLSIGFSFGI